MKVLVFIVSVTILAGVSPKEITGGPCKGGACRFQSSPAKRSGNIVV